MWEKLKNELMSKYYTALNLPIALVEELKVWRLAFCSSYGKNVSYAEMIRGMLDSLVDTEPGVQEELESILKRHPELQDKMNNYRGQADEEPLLN